MTLVKHMSDLHLDVNREPFIDATPENANDIILMLTGDIAEIDSLRLYSEFLIATCPQYRAVLLNLGNHEFYNGSLVRAKNKLLEKLKDHNISNLHIMDRNSVIFDDVKFIGATLWTDMDKGNPMFALNVSDPYNGLNDYKRIRIGTTVDPYKRRITPRDVLVNHIQDFSYIKSELTYDTRKTVVVTHHAPLLSIIERGKYSGDRLNPAYGSHLEEFVADSNIDFWFHGHTHCTTDNEFFGTRIICNARGYSTRENPHFNSNLIIEI